MLLLLLIQSMLVRSFPADILFNHILKYSTDFDDALNMAQVLPEIIPFVSPIVNIKISCGLIDSDVWPLKTLNLHGTFNHRCLALFEQHSHIYQEVSISVHLDNHIRASNIIEVSKPNTISIIFTRGTNQLLNSTHILYVLDSIPLNQNKHITLIMMYMYY